MKYETFDIFIFAAVCYVVAEALTEIIDALVWIHRGKLPPED